ncbi:hypothetical protein PTSG_01080 [Salpingoeca rosetta]|uniref:Uncharacterized protein n=1 Tax=Salpingoeca rosetta (strain ATCC 50818 / BSB-021) TaxID=946362 RepID=F2TYC0_SALR5|nr:uncharacterized protein PTSG_01080 [Salpingoeca rosetta]EGD76379.1 hypothetical protein PTSG_01080 [Salpingoeca rosetta]|eukprot:XP_004998554.1 hypothetical protein PTSG_01080 [Salpingoeca rosetta]
MPVDTSLHSLVYPAAYADTACSCLPWSRNNGTHTATLSDDNITITVIIAMES